MIDVTVKTLDSNVYQFQVADESTVKDFKEQIATEVNVPWDKQRIIFCGKVLQDERQLADCKVHGKTVHLVQRLPQFPNQPGSGSSTANQPPTPPRGAQYRFPMPGRGLGNIFVEAIAMPSDDGVQGDNLGQIIRQVVSSITNLIPNGTVRLPTDGAQASGPEMQSVHNRLIVISSLLRLAYNGVSALEDPATVAQDARPRSDSEPQAATPAADSADSQTQTSTPPAETPPAEATAPPSETPRDPNRPFSSMTQQEIQGDQQLSRLLSLVYDELDLLQERFQPFLTRYRSLLSSEATTPEQLNEEATRRLSNRVSEVTHSVSHINHLLSDLEIDTRNPRSLVVRSGLAPLAVQVSVNSVSLNPSMPDLQAAVSSAFNDMRNQAAQSEPAPTGAQSTQTAPETPTPPDTPTPTPAPAAPTRSSGSNTNTTQRFAFLYPSRFVRRLSSATSRSVDRIRSTQSPAPTREETTASNTTTGTTDTTTTAGANSNRSTPNPAVGIPAAFTISTPSNITVRPSPVVRGVVDPYLICDSSSWPRRQPEVTRTTAPQSTTSSTATSTTETSDTSFGTTSDSETSLSEALARSAEALLRSILPGLGSLTSTPLTVLFNSLFNITGRRRDEVFLLGLLSMLASHLTMGDLLQMMISRDYESLNRVRQPFRDYLNSGLLQNQPYDEATLQPQVDRVVDEALQELGPAEQASSTQPSVDYIATMSAFLRDHLRKLFAFVLTAEASDSFGEQLFTMLHEMTVNVFSLMSLCGTDSNQWISSMMNSRFGAESTLVSGLINRVVIETNNENSSLRQYIRHRNVPAASTPYEEMDVDFGPPTFEAIPVVRPVLTQEAPHSRSMDMPEESVSHAAALEALRAAVPSVTSAPSGAPWVTDVPVGWAPIIARDVAAQNGQQRPLSDAYLEGMPSKRRRVMKQANPSRLSNVTASLQEAIQRAGVRPRTSTDALFADIEQNRIILQTALQRSIRDRLARRLTEDRDFESDKFPNAKRMTE